MNKAELIDMVAERAGHTKKDTTKILDTLFDTLKERLYQEDDISIAGFGKFGIRKRDARVARNPKTGEDVNVGAKNVCFFHPAAALKEYIQD